MRIRPIRSGIEKGSRIEEEASDGTDEQFRDFDHAV